MADILHELLADAAAEREHGRLRHGAGRPRPQDRRPGDFRDQFAGAAQRYMAVSPETGKLLYSLGRSSRASAVVEFGTSFGVSTLFLAAAIKDNGGGRLIGTEFEPTKVAATRSSVDRAGVADIVEIREGDALETLSVNLPPEIHLVLLDGAKDMYADIIRLLEPRLIAGALVVADNAGRAESFREYVRGGDAYVSTGVDDLEISCKVG